MKWLSGCRFLCQSFCLAALWLTLVNANPQDLLGDALGSNSELWKSFQEEMHTLEQAAHRVNTLLSSAAHSPQTPSGSAAVDQEARPAENIPDVTVLGSPNQLKNGQVIDAKVDTAVEAEKKDENTEDTSVLDSSKSNPLSISSLFNSLGFFKNLPEPWWKGKNVCVERSEKVEEKEGDKEKEVDQHVFVMGTGTFEHCKQTAGKYICTTVTSTPESTKTVSTTYQCCEGFRRQPEGCVAGEEAEQVTPDQSPDRDAQPQSEARSHYKVVDVGKSVEDSYSSQSEGGNVELKDPVEVVESLGAKEFAAMMRSKDVMRTLADKNITIFAPLDSAMRSHHTDFQESIGVNRVVRAVEEGNDIGAYTRSERAGLSGQNIVLTHITDSLLDIDDFTNEMVVKSQNNDSPLRVNIYPGRQSPVITVNCARLQSWGELAKHARVHTIDRVLEPVTQSVIDILSQPQFSQFKQYLEQEGLMEMLANASAITVFAPNNDAWDKLGSGLKDKYARGDACIDKVLRHHILPLTLCAAPAAEGRLSTADVDGELVRLSRDPDSDNQLMVDDKGRVVQEDIMATNGVVHVLDKVLSPKSAKPLSELLVSSNHTGWLELLDRAGLLEELNKQENITVFVPTEQALAEEQTRTLLDSMDDETLRRTLLYHVTQQAPSCDLQDRGTLTTRTGDQLRVTLFNPYAMFAGVEPRAAVQCVPLGLTDGKACHVTAHEVTRLLLPPNSTTLQLLAADHSQLSTLKRLLEGTQIEKDLEENSELLKDGFTLLAPSDDAFNKLDEEVLSKLLTDKKFADEVIRMHILKEPICCGSITSVPWPFTNSVRTLDNRKLEVDRRNKKVMFGYSVTEQCDVITTDGIVHIIDRVILPEASSVKLGNVAFGTPQRRIMLFGI